MNTTALSTEQTWDLQIKPHDKLFNLHLKDVWNYRDLLMLLVRRDFVSFYKQTILGPLWFFIQPIFTTFLFTFIFHTMGGFSTDGSPAQLFYLSGIVTWNYFADCFNKTSTVFRDNAGIFGKVYFPRLIMPLSIIVSNLVRFGVQFLLFLGMFVFFLIKGESVQPNIYMAFFPLIILLMALLGLGAGLIITAMTTKYRDLAFLVVFGIQLLMYASPVIYSTASQPKYQKFLMLNPLSGLIEGFRYGFLGHGHFPAMALLYSAVFSIVVFFAGLIVFNKVEKNFVDTV